MQGMWTRTAQNDGPNLDAQHLILEVQVEWAQPVYIALLQQLLHVTLQVWLADGQPKPQPGTPSPWHARGGRLQHIKGCPCGELPDGKLLHHCNVVAAPRECQSGTLLCWGPCFKGGPGRMCLTLGSC